MLSESKHFSLCVLTSGLIFAAGEEFAGVPQCLRLCQLRPFHQSEGKTGDGHAGNRRQNQVGGGTNGGPQGDSGGLRGAGNMHCRRLDRQNIWKVYCIFKSFFKGHPAGRIMKALL